VVGRGKKREVSLFKKKKSRKFNPKPRGVSGWSKSAKKGRGPRQAKKNKFERYMSGGVSKRGGGKLFMV